MNSTDTAKEPSLLSRFPNRWALLPVGLLGILVTVQVVLFRLSSGDPSFAIEPEYYQKAVNWDNHVRAKQTSDRLGWHGEPKMSVNGTGGATLKILLTDPSGSPVTGATLSAEAFPNARANQVQRVMLRETTPGLYEAAVTLAHRGEWEVRLSAVRELDIYSSVLRVVQPGE